MSYVDEVIAKVIKNNPGEPEFHQTVREVLESLRVVVDRNEEKFRKAALLERLCEPEHGFGITALNGAFAGANVDHRCVRHTAELCQPIYRHFFISKQFTDLHDRPLRSL